MAIMNNTDVQMENRRLTMFDGFIKIASCNFCGYINVDVMEDDNCMYFVRCPFCNKEGMHGNIEEAIESWNKEQGMNNNGI